MFEFSLALRYLIPRKSRLSASLVALLSVVVISLVVWLILVFLSVTEGIEKGWLHKLTTLNAPLRITPTSHYYSSYYYQIDGKSSVSHYTCKSLKEKMAAPYADPYNPLEDEELPAHFPLPERDKGGQIKDPVMGLTSILKKTQGITYQDFELSGALMRLQLLNIDTGSQGYLTQVSYLSTLPSRAPAFSSLVMPLREEDLNHLLALAGRSTELSRQDAPTLHFKTTKSCYLARTHELLKDVQIEALKTHYPFWQIPPHLLPERTAFLGHPQYRNGSLYRIDLFQEREEAASEVTVWREGEQLFLKRGQQEKEGIASSTPLLVQGTLTFEVKRPSATTPGLFHVQTHLQETSLEGEVSLEGLDIIQAHLPSRGATALLSRNEEGLLSLPTNEEQESGVLLAKSFLDSGVKVGDRGYLSYSGTTTSSLQEHRLPIFVAGFYDPGVLSIGNKCILVPSHITQAINASSSSFNIDKTQSCGILIWFPSLEKTADIKEQITTALKEQGLEEYWKVTAFYEYEFAKDLLEQFHSDKLLFMLVGVIILIVGCCNIVSMLVLLVNDKSREIGILQAMGSSKRSIATVFGACGMVMGLLSSCIGASAALLTLHHIDSLVHLLSFLEGHDAFNATFFGSSLPNTLSHGAVWFVLIATPLLSLIAGLIPAIKACRMQPSTLLRNS